MTNWHQPNWVDDARNLQKQGLTFTEIADKLRIERASIVQALYWDVVR
jgi:orotate phosphoribosyltransferase-like protein